MPPKPGPCGVGTGGYQRHKRAGEKPCDACRRARSEYRKRERAEKARKQREQARAETLARQQEVRHAA